MRKGDALRSGLSSYRSVPRRLASQFDSLYSKAISSPSAAKKHYLALLAFYKRLLKTESSSAVKHYAYLKIQKVYRSAQSETSVTFLAPLAFILAVVLITLLLRPGITGLLGFQTQFVSEEISLSSSSSSTWDLDLQGVPDSLVFDGTWNGKGIGQVYVTLDGRRVLAVDTTLLPTLPGEPYHFKRICVDTCSLQTQAISAQIEFDTQGAEIVLEKVSYLVSSNKPPEWTALTNTYVIDGTFQIDLDELFADPDGDTLNYIVTPEEDLDVSLEESILTATVSSGFMISTIAVAATDGAALAKTILVLHSPEYDLGELKGPAVVEAVQDSNR